MATLKVGHWEEIKDGGGLLLSQAPQLILSGAGILHLTVGIEL